MGGRAPELITTDEYTAYEGAILEAFGTEVVPPRTGKPGRPRKPYKVSRAGLHYATVHKTRNKGEVVDVVTQVIFGTAAAVEAALVKSGVSHRINTAFVERHNGTDRNRNSGRCGKTYCFSKDWWFHRAVTFFTMYSYNFCWPVRTLKTESGEDRTPAMMAKLTDHVWTLAEWIKRPAVQTQCRSRRKIGEEAVLLTPTRHDPHATFKRRYHLAEPPVNRWRAPYKGSTGRVPPRITWPMTCGPYGDTCPDSNGAW